MKNKLTIAAICIFSMISCSSDIKIGEENGEYEDVSAKKLESRATNYVDKKVRVEFDVAIGAIEIDQSRKRLLLDPAPIGENGVNYVEILIPQDSPLYDQVVEVDPQFEDSMTVSGTFKGYGDNEKYFFILPDQIVFHPKE